MGVDLGHSSEKNHHLTSYSKALELLLGLHKFVNLNDETITLENSLGRVLSGEVKALIDNPPADVSSMDGYAINSSDERLKDNIQTDNLGLDFINELRTVTYNWKASDKVDTSLPGYMHPDTTDFDKLSKDTSVTMNGLIAQEVKAALDKVGADASKYAVWSTDDDGIQRISESSFVMPLIKAVQELSAKVKALEDA